jgi:hypothetical protein
MFGGVGEEGLLFEEPLMSRTTAEPHPLEVPASVRAAAERRAAAAAAAATGPAYYAESTSGAESALPMWMWAAGGVVVLGLGYLMFRKK